MAVLIGRLLETADLPPQQDDEIYQWLELKKIVPTFWGLTDKREKDNAPETGIPLGELAAYWLDQDAMAATVRGRQLERPTEATTAPKANKRGVAGEGALKDSAKPGE